MAFRARQVFGTFEKRSPGLFAIGFQNSCSKDEESFNRGKSYSSSQRKENKEVMHSFGRHW